VIIGDGWNRRILHLSGSGLMVTISVYKRIGGGGYWIWLLMNRLRNMCVI
jgi:hypothetical protein